MRLPSKPGYVVAVAEMTLKLQPDLVTGFPEPIPPASCARWEQLALTRRVCGPVCRPRPPPSGPSGAPGPRSSPRSLRAELPLPPPPCCSDVLQFLPPSALGRPVGERSCFPAPICRLPGPPRPFASPGTWCLTHGSLWSLLPWRGSE